MRKLEHRLQLAQELQTFTLPRDETARRVLARSMGEASVEELVDNFGKHVDAVVDMSERLLSE